MGEQTEADMSAQMKLALDHLAHSWEKRLDEIDAKIAVLDARVTAAEMNKTGDRFHNSRDLPVH